MGNRNSGRRPKAVEAVRSANTEQNLKTLQRYLVNLDPTDQKQRTRLVRLIESIYECSLEKLVHKPGSPSTTAPAMSLLEYAVGRPLQAVAMEIKRSPEENAERILQALEFLGSGNDKPRPN